MSRKTPNIRRAYHGYTPSPGGGSGSGSGSGSESPFLLDGDDFAGGGFNPLTGDYFNSNYDSGTYSLAGTSPFQTVSGAGLPTPPGGSSSDYVGRIQWAISGQNELQPFNFGGNGEDDGWDLIEYYFESWFYVPDGFPWCGGKLFRSRRLVSGSGVGAAVHLETGPQDDPIATIDPIVAYSALFHIPPADGEDVDFFNVLPRDTWTKLGFWLKYNSFTGSSANSDGFARFYVGSSLEDEKTGVVFSQDVAHVSGFNFIGSPLNMSYGACGGSAASSGAIFMYKPRLYSTKP